MGLFSDDLPKIYNALTFKIKICHTKSTKRGRWDLKLPYYCYLTFSGVDGNKTIFSKTTKKKRMKQPSRITFSLTPSLDWQTSRVSVVFTGSLIQANIAPRLVKVNISPRTQRDSIILAPLEPWFILMLSFLLLCKA